MNATKRSFLTSVVSLVLCLTMFLGTTFAWFTDIASSIGNVIQSGKLDAEMYWSDDLLSADSTEWKNAEKTTVFNYNNWEPGYTEVKYIKVVNNGNLNFKWTLSIEAEGKVTDLSDVIEVYYVNPVSAELESLDGLTPAGTLTDVLANKTGEAGRLTPGANQILAIAFHMDEFAGNDYQEKSLCDKGFSLKLLATQDVGEEDSFGPDYDADSQWPDNIVVGNTASTEVTLNPDNTLASAVTMTSADGKISATLPAGTLMAQGTTKATLNVADVESSGANITLDENEAALSIDVHIHGVAEGNDAVMAISVKELLPVGLNIGNYRFYHVEDGQTVAMELLANGATAKHNNYEYDPATGDVVLHLASFSEVALVADTENAWNGVVDNKLVGEGTAENPYIIASADELAGMNQLVSNDDSYASACYKLVANVNFGGYENYWKDGIIDGEQIKENVFYPIGYWAKQDGKNAAGEEYYDFGNGFSGTFDGNGNTISGICQRTWDMDGNYDNGYWDAAMGLFGAVYNATIKNLIVEDFESDGEFTPTGVIAAYAGGNSTFENISLTNCNPRVYNTGNGGIVGLNYNSTSGVADNLVFRNITVDQTNKISALWGSYDVSCGGILGRLRENSKHNGTNTEGQKNTVRFENCHVAAIMDVNNDVCANYQYYQYRYSGMFIGTVDYIGDVPAVGLTDVVSAVGCTYTLGDWNEYWYCELVANSLASYTHDHQFGRLTKISSLTEIQDENGNWNKQGNFVIPNADNTAAECYHIFKNSEGQLYQHFHNVADESNPNIYENFDLNGDGELNDLKEDRQCYFIPFNQLLTGYGWGSSPQFEFAGITNNPNGVVKSETKFESLGIVTTYRPGQTTTLGQLVNSIVDDSKLSKPSVYAAVSPATESDNVSATYSLDLSDWKNSTITFAEGSTGSAKIVITDYFYCTPTIIYLNPEEAAERFIANSTSAQNAYTQITLGTLFGVKDGSTIGNVTATVTDPNGNETTVTGTSFDWASKTIDLTKDGTWTVVIKDDDAYCSVTTTTFTVNKVDKFTNKFDKNFLYRVGNENTVDIGYIFGEIETAVGLSSVNVSITNVAGNAAGTFASNSTWTTGDLQFTGTGVVEVTISADGANDFVLHLEVVDAKNIISAAGSNGTDVVLLKDVTIASGGTANYKNCTVYGNGFTFDVRGGMNMYNSKQGHGIIITNGATIDNLVVIGDVYDTYGAYSNQEDYTSAFDATNTTFTNCYISNCSTPIRANGVTIKDTTLYGGTVANLIISGGTNTLENVTTVNYNDDRAVLGLGIVVSDGAADNTRIVLNGTLKQYNYVCENDASNVPGDEAKAVFNSMFGDSFSNYKTSTGYVNTGIVFMTESLNTDIITDNANTGYLAKDDARVALTALGATANINGAIYAPRGSGATVDNGYSFDSDKHVSTTQGDYLPTPNFNLGDQTLSKDNDDDTNYLIGDINGVQAMYVKGETPITLDLTNLMTVYKYEGVYYNVSAKCLDPNGNEVASTNGKVILTVKGAYTLVFTVDDNVFYGVDGKAITKSVTRTYEIPFELSVYEKSIADATITVSSNALTGEYVSSGTNKKYKMYPLKAITTIMDDANKDGTLETFNFKANIQSAVLTPKGNNAFSSVSTITITYTTGQVLTFVLGIPNELNSPGASNGGKTFSVYIDSSNGIYLQSDGAVASSSAAEGTWPITSWSFKGTSGKVITNSTQVTINFTKPSSSGTCIAEGSMITLADGSKKAVEDLRKGDIVMAFDHVAGKIVYRTINIVGKTYADSFYKNVFVFDDGTELTAINEHGIYDLDLGMYVNIGELNYQNYIDHRFVSVDSQGNIGVKRLVDVVTTIESGYKYDIVTNETLNYVVEDTLSVSHELVAIINSFEFGDNMVYDAEAMQTDIAEYGLYTYDDFAEYCEREVFEQYNMAMMKIGVGKGLYTYEHLVYLLTEIALNDNVQIID